jgi:hypothetical protein
MLLIFIAKETEEEESRDIIFSFYFLFDLQSHHTHKNYTEVSVAN